MKTLSKCIAKFLALKGVELQEGLNSFSTYNKAKAKEKYLEVRKESLTLTQAHKILAMSRKDSFVHIPF